MVEMLKPIMYLEPGDVLHKGFPTILIAIRCIDLVRRNLRKTILMHMQARSYIVAGQGLLRTGRSLEYSARASVPTNE